MIRPLKVMLFTDHHMRGSGGAEEYFFTLKDHLSLHRDIHVISMGFGTADTQTEHEIIVQDSASQIRRLCWNTFCHGPTFKRLRKQVQLVNPDVIHLHNVRRHTPAVLKAINPWPVVQTVHDFAPICPTMTNVHRNLQPCPQGLRLRCLLQHRGRYPLYAYPSLLPAFIRMRQQLKKTVQHFIAPSPLLAHYLENNHFNPVSVVVPFIKGRTLQDEYVREAGTYFLFAGRVSSYKGADILIREFIKACTGRPDLQLRIAGTGPLESVLKSRIKKAGIARQVEFLGHIQDKTHLTQLYRHAIALVFPITVMESFGQVMTEAMTEARPVIGTNFGTPKWLIKEGETGLLFNPRQPGDLAQKLLHLADNPAQAIHMGEQARESLRQFPTTEECINTLVNIYRRVTNQPLPQ